MILNPEALDEGRIEVTLDHKEAEWLAVALITAHTPMIEQHCSAEEVRWCELAASVFDAASRLMRPTPPDAKAVAP